MTKLLDNIRNHFTKLSPGYYVINPLTCDALRFNQLGHVEGEDICLRWSNATPFSSEDAARHMLAQLVAVDHKYRSYTVCKEV